MRGLAGPERERAGGGRTKASREDPAARWGGGRAGRGVHGVGGRGGAGAGAAPRPSRPAALDPARPMGAHALGKPRRVSRDLRGGRGEGVRGGVA